MKQAKQPSEKELSQGYEIVPIVKPQIQPNQNARLNGQLIDLECDETMEYKSYED